MPINIDATTDEVQQGRLNKFKPFYDRFLELDLSENNTTMQMRQLGLLGRLWLLTIFIGIAQKMLEKMFI